MAAGSKAKSAGGAVCAIFGRRGEAGSQLSTRSTNRPKVPRSTPGNR